MSHSYTNLIAHVMWSTQNQEFTISPSTKDQLNAYLNTLIKIKKGKLLLSGGTKDHVHLLFSFPPDLSISNIMGYIKSTSSKWLKFNKFVDPNFSWQDGYLTLSTEPKFFDRVCDYIRSEETRHTHKNYAQELLDILKMQNIQYEDQYYLKNSFSKMFVHTIWSTHNRVAYLDKNLQTPLYKIMEDTVLKNRGQILEIGGIEDHVHTLIEFPRHLSLSDLIREMKNTTTNWLKRIEPVKFQDFAWQPGYGAFTVSFSNIEVIKLYIQKQEEHHKECSFQTEWNRLVGLI